MRATQVLVLAEKVLLKEGMMTVNDALKILVGSPSYGGECLSRSHETE
jgi:hypothetical protein